MEGQDLFDGLAHGGAGGEGGAEALAHAAALEFEAEFEIEELFKDEALVRGGGGGHQLDHRRSRFGEVDGFEGLEARGKMKAMEERGGERLLRFDAVSAAALNKFLEDGPDDAAHPFGGELGSPGSGAAERLVYGDDAAHFEHGELCVGACGSGRGEDLELWLDHLEAPGGCALSCDGGGSHGGAGGLELAVDGDHLAELEFVFEVSAVEPDALDGPQALAERQLEHWPGACAQEDAATHLADNRGHGAGDERGHGLRVEAVLVAEGEVIEEVFDCVDAAGGEAGGDALADPLDELDRG